MHGGGKIFLHSLKRRPADASRDAFGGQVDAAWPANAFAPPHASLLKAQGKKKEKKKRKQGVSKNNFFFIFSEVQIEDKAVQASD